MGSASYACRTADERILALPKRDRIFGSRKKEPPPDRAETGSINICDEIDKIDRFGL